MVNSTYRKRFGFSVMYGPIMNGKNVSKTSEQNKNIAVIVSLNFKCFSPKFIYDEKREEHPNPVVK